VAHLLTPHVNLGYSGTLLPPQSKGLSSFTTVLFGTWQSKPYDTPDVTSGLLTPAKASLPLPRIESESLSPKANTLPLQHPSPSIHNKISFQTLPKTSYYKLIDWWLGYSLNMLVFIMGLHTYVAHMCFLAKNKSFTIFSKPTEVCVCCVNSFSDSSCH
jgi:hypothetical protein